MWVILGIVAAVALAVLSAAIVAGSSQGPTDFTAFYCAGTVIRDHGDPYHALPLGACEQRLERQGVDGVKGVVLPAPLPPYALALFAALAFLPYEVAIAAWGLLLVAAVAATVVALGGVCGLRWPVVVLTLVMIDIAGDLLLGQPVPLVVAAIALAAWALYRGADRMAGILACVTMLQPQVGLPACLSLFAYRPGARVPLLAGAAAAALLSVIVVPADLSMEYLTRVLPQHAASEIPWPWQYSLTNALHALGVGDEMALALGSLSYLAMIVLGMVLAPRVSARFHEPGMLVAIPPALATLGGSFIHISQVACAVPAALLFAGRGQGRVARLGAVACVLLTISGVQFGFGNGAGFTMITAAVAGVLAATLFRPAMLAGVSTAAAVLVLGAALHGLQPIRGVAGIPPSASQGNVDSLAEDSWSRFVRAEDPGPRVQRLELFAKAPTWAGLTLICVAALLTAFRKATGGTADGDPRYGAASEVLEAGKG